MIPCAKCGRPARTVVAEGQTCIGCLLAASGPGEEIMGVILNAGWAKVCESIREAGKQVIANPRPAIDALRRTADALESYEERKEKSSG